MFGLGAWGFDTAGTFRTAHNGGTSSPQVYQYYISQTQELSVRHSAWDLLLRALPMEKTIYSRSYKTLLWLLYDKRRAAGLTQAELAERLQEPQQWVSSIETGQRRVDAIELREICRALGVTYVDFIRELEERIQRESEG